MYSDSFFSPFIIDDFTPDDRKHSFEDVAVPVVAGVSAVASVSSVAGVHCNVAVPEPIFLNIYGAQESIPSNEFRQPM
jgi:hypothetical protein